MEGAKWKQRFSVARLLSFMGREGLGNPTKEADYQIGRMRSFLAKYAPELEETPISAAIVFLADQVVLNVGETETDVPVLRATKLKGFLRSSAGKPLPKETYRQLEELFDAAAG